MVASISAEVEVPRVTFIEPLHARSPFSVPLSKRKMNT
jgi:hypothetical protein